MRTEAQKQQPTVLMVIRDLGALGGAEQQAWRLAQGLYQCHVPVELVTGCWRGRKPGLETREGIPIHYISTASHFIRRRGGWRLSQYVMGLALGRFLWQHRQRYQVIHFHAVDFLAAMGVLCSRQPTIIKMRASGEWSDLQYIRRNWRGLEPAILINLLRRADRVISLNEESTGELLAAGFQRSQITTMVNGIEARNFSPRTDYRLRQPPRLIFVGRLEPQKDVGTLLQALARLEQRDVQVVIVGDGPQRRHFEVLSRELGLGERVIFSGRVPDVRPFLEEADLFVLPSVAEGISNALLEAMSSGLPCLVSDIPGNRTVISNGQDGQFFPPGEVEALTQQLNHFLADEALRRQVGQAARDKVMERFAMEVVVEAYLTLYHQLAAGPNSREASQPTQKVTM